MWLFLDLLAGESLVVLMSSIFPNFVISLALTAFANGLWMSVGGFLVSPTILNPFWKYVFHYIDYVNRSHHRWGPSLNSRSNDTNSRLAILRLPGHDGQRVWPSDLRLRRRLQLHVRYVSGVTMPDRWKRGSSSVWVSHWENRRMGWDFDRYPYRVSTAGLDGDSHKKKLDRISQ